MSEPTITCPNCNYEIKLTESLAAPLLASTRRQFEEEIAKNNAEIEKREQQARNSERELAEAKAKLDEQIDEKVEERLKIDLVKITEKAEKKARNIIESELRDNAAELQNLKDILKNKDNKLAEAQKAQVDFLKKQSELDDEKREIELTIQTRIQEGKNALLQQATKDAEEKQKLKVLEKEQTIQAMQRQIEDLKRRSEQGSQQLQGEALELQLENLLSTKFPFDKVEPVPKGEFGGDVIHKVLNATHQHCGTILWEFKQTKNWSDSWLVKLRNDQRAAKADIAVIVSNALPKEIDSFEMKDGVWVAHPSIALPIAIILRQSLIDISIARKASQGLQSKTELVYQYLTGPNFRLRVEAIVEAFSTMQSDLDAERKIFTKQWAKREAQIDRVMNATIGMYGDLQGIAGKSLQEIEGLELNALELNPDDNNSEN